MRRDAAPNQRQVAITLVQTFLLACGHATNVPRTGATTSCCSKILNKFDLPPLCFLVLENTILITKHHAATRLTAKPKRWLHLALSPLSQTHSLTLSGVNDMVLASKPRPLPRMRLSKSLPVA